jgi:hypothetical protein
MQTEKSRLVTSRIKGGFLQGELKETLAMAPERQRDLGQQVP